MAMLAVLSSRTVAREVEEAMGNNLTTDHQQPMEDKAPVLVGKLLGMDKFLPRQGRLDMARPQVMDLQPHRRQVSITGKVEVEQCLLRLNLLILVRLVPYSSLGRGRWHLLS